MRCVTLADASAVAAPTRDRPSAAGGCGPATKRHRCLRRSPRRQNATLTAVPGIKVGHHTLDRAADRLHRWCLIEGGARPPASTCAAPRRPHATPDLLEPGEDGRADPRHRPLRRQPVRPLDARDGVLRYLEEKNIGIAYGGRHIPIVPGASIFDLGVGDATVRPTADCGYRAAQAATARARRRRQRRRRRGRDASASSPAWTRADEERRRHRGDRRCPTASSSPRWSWSTRSATSSIRPPERSSPACATPDGKRFRRRARHRCDRATPRASRGDNSTIGVIATNAQADQSAGVVPRADDRRRLRARDLADPHRWSTATPCSRSRPAARPGRPDLITLGALAADVMATAVIRAATQATGLPEPVPAVRDLK